MNEFVIPAAVALVLLFWGVGAYRRLVRMQNQVRNAYAQIVVQLKRRHELVPALVEAAKTYMTHEREMLEAVIDARNQAVTPGAKAAADPSDTDRMQRMAAAEELLSSSIGSMLALTNNYPELKVDQNMMQLTEEVRANGNRIAFARQAYNDGVMQYNASRQQFPVSIIAFLFVFKPAQTFRAMDVPEEHGPARVSS
ncbi:MAG: LemA family protein [Noviherbaspirillum sp.]